MARGLLVTFSGYPSDAACLMPDVGLASLAGTLLAHGHEVQVLDFNSTDMLQLLTPRALTDDLARLLPALEGEPDGSTLKLLTDLTQAMEDRLLATSGEMATRLAAAVEAQRAHFVGFKLWSGDGFLCCSRMAELLRARYPGLKLFAGGPAVMFAEETIFQHTRAFDALVDGEGEEAILGLAAFAERGDSLADVPNLILPTESGHVRTRHSVVADPDRLPFPVYDPEIYRSLTDDRQLRLFVLDDSRGCFNACRFCISRHGTGAQWRAKSPDRIIEEMGQLQNKFGASIFRLGGNSTPATYLERLAARIEQSRMQIAYSAYTTVSGLSRSLDRVAASGCQTLFLGVESFVAEDLPRLNKSHSAEQAAAAVETCIASGIVPLVSLIVPAPGQSADAIARNRAMALALCAGKPAVVIAQFAAIFPRTDWWRDPARYGFRLLCEPDAYRLRLATWKVRHIIPPTFWPPLPYAYDGMESRRFAAVNAQFQRDLRQGGVVVNLSNEAMMMAAPSGRTPAELHAHFRRMIFTQDAEAIAAFVREVNGGMAAAVSRRSRLNADGLRPREYAEVWSAGAQAHPGAGSSAAAGRPTPTVGDNRCQVR